MRFTVGGRQVDLTPDDVLEAMKGVEAEPIREHIVEVEGFDYPPKQVFALATALRGVRFQRQDFTTMDAQRVLTRLNFRCRRAPNRVVDPRRFLDAPAPPTPPSPPMLTSASGGDDRLAAIEAALATAQVAIAGLHARLSALEK